MPSIFNSKAEGAAICAKHTYNSMERVVELDRSLTKKTVDVPYEAEKQFQNLIMEVSCLVWVQALLGIINGFVKADFNIPQFCFVRPPSRSNNLHRLLWRRQAFCLRRLLTLFILFSLVPVYQGWAFAQPCPSEIGHQHPMRAQPLGWSQALCPACTWLPRMLWGITWLPFPYFGPLFCSTSARTLQQSTD